MSRGWDDHDDMEEDGCLRHQNQMSIVQQWMFAESSSQETPLQLSVNQHSSPLCEFDCESGVTSVDAQRDAALQRLHECNWTSHAAITSTTGFPGAAFDAGERFDLLACHSEWCASAICDLVFVTDVVCSRAETGVLGEAYDNVRDPDALLCADDGVLDQPHHEPAVTSTKKKRRRHKSDGAGDSVGLLVCLGAALLVVQL